MKKQETKNRTLTEEQTSVVKKMIVNSMRNVYTDAGALPGDGFENISGVIADKIIKNVQTELMQPELKKELKKGKRKGYKLVVPARGSLVLAVRKKKK